MIFVEYLGSAHGLHNELDLSRRHLESSIHVMGENLLIAWADVAWYRSVKEIEPPTQ
jgi:hypothetical protein